MRVCTPAPLLELLRNRVLRAGPAGLAAGGVTSIDTIDIRSTLRVNEIVNWLFPQGHLVSMERHIGGAGTHTRQTHAHISDLSFQDYPVHFKVANVRVAMLCDRGPVSSLGT